MGYCKKCGNPVFPDDLYCSVCGTPTEIGGHAANKPARKLPSKPADMPAKASVDPPVDKPAGAPPHTPPPATAAWQITRCQGCGRVIEAGKTRCDRCGSPAPGSDAFKRMATQGATAREIRMTRGPGALLMVWLSALWLIGTLVFLYLLMASNFFSSWMDYATSIPDILWFAVPILLIIFTISWHKELVKECRKNGLTITQYKNIFRESKMLPKAFFDSLPKNRSGAPYGHGAGKPAPSAARKVKSYAKVNAGLLLLLPLLVWASVYTYTDATGNGTGGSILGNITGGDKVSGHVFATDDTYSSGMVTVGAAYFFDNGTLYVGQRDYSNAEFRQYSSSYGTAGSSYTMVGNTIYLKAGGSTYTYNYNASNHTITRGSTVLKRVR